MSANSSSMSWLRETIATRRSCCTFPRPIGRARPRTAAGTRPVPARGTSPPGTTRPIADLGGEPDATPSPGRIWRQPSQSATAGRAATAAINEAARAVQNGGAGRASLGAATGLIRSPRPSGSRQSTAPSALPDPVARYPFRHAGFPKSGPASGVAEPRLPEFVRDGDGSCGAAGECRAVGGRFLRPERDVGDAEAGPQRIRQIDEQRAEPPLRWIALGRRLVVARQAINDRTAGSSSVDPMPPS